MRTDYGSKIDIRKNEANSYRFQQGQWIVQPEDDMSIPHGCGAIVSTPNDSAFFISALFNNKLVSENSLAEMIKIKDGYGKGLMPFSLGNKIAYGHNGGIRGFVSNLFYFPDENVAISVQANGMNYSFHELYIGILSIYFNLPFDIPDFTLKSIELKAEKMESVNFNVQCSMGSGRWKQLI